MFSYIEITLWMYPKDSCCWAKNVLRIDLRWDVGVKSSKNKIFKPQKSYVSFHFQCHSVQQSVKRNMFLEALVCIVCRSVNTLFRTSKCFFLKMRFFGLEGIAEMLVNNPSTSNVEWRYTKHVLIRWKFLFIKTSKKIVCIFSQIFLLKFKENNKN